jgi:AcrR family transcriptional regulator
MSPKAAQTAAKILDVAQRLFVERNYADVTMDQIAAAAEVTKGALYHHFKSKEELYLAMMHGALAESRALHQRGVEQVGSCRSRLRVLTEAFLIGPQANRELMSLVRRDINVFRNPARDQLVRAYQAALPEPVEEIIRDGIRDAELTAAEPRLLSWQYVALVEVILSDYAARVVGDLDAKLEQVLDLFFRGVTAPLGMGANA